MDSNLYFTRLRPYRLLFRKGVPMLMYHKLGPCPSGVRLRFLHVSARLFRRQLGELKAEGYQTIMPGEAVASADNRSLRISLTFDDGFENVLHHGLDALRDHGFRAIQFLVPGLLGRMNEWEVATGEAPQRLMDAAGVREWLAAGHEIGAHTMTHPNLKRIPVARAREEIQASKKSLEDLFGVKVNHFCYPYGGYNEAIRDLVAEAGFVTACTTRAGLNSAETPPLELHRFTARPVSVKIRDLWRIWLARPWTE